MELPDVPPDHPRVYLRPNDLADIRENLRADESAEAWEIVRAAEGCTYCDAFVSLVTGDDDRGRAAIDRCLGRFERGETDPAHGPHHFDHDLHAGACVYDWCYDLLTPDERDRFVAAFTDYASGHAPGYPAGTMSTNTVVGHACEGWLMTGQLPAGVAIYDEHPEMYTHAARFFLSEIVPLRNFFYPSHMHNQGTDYAATRCLPEATAAWLFERLGAEDVFVDDLRYVPYWHLYALRPDRLFLPSGDDFDRPGTRWNKALLALLVGNYYDDPFVRAFANTDRLRSEWSPVHWLWELLVGTPGGPETARDALAQTKYFGSPMGEMIARTGWDVGTESTDAIAQMHIGEYYFGNHQHRDFGTFQLYCGGPLAIDSGHYEPIRYGEDHWRYYLKPTLAHNGLLIFDPETQALVFGGQRTDPGPPDPDTYEVNYSATSFAELQSRCRWGEVTGRAWGPSTAEPRFSHIAGDITGAYYDRTVDRVTRSMVAARPGDERYPLVFVVSDDVVATDPDFRKAWLLHTIDEPAVTGTTATVQATGSALHGGEYHGKLVSETLRPDPATIETVGGEGKECWNPVTGENHPSEDNLGGEMGRWRVEVSPAEDARQHRFFHVLSMMEPGTDAPRVEPLETPELLGASVLDLALCFNRTEAPLSACDLTVPGSDTTHVCIAGLAPGIWTVSGPSAQRSVDVGAQERCLFFDGPPGDYTLAQQRG